VESTPEQIKLHLMPKDKSSDTDVILKALNITKIEKYYGSGHSSQSLELKNRDKKPVVIRPMKKTEKHTGSGNSSLELINRDIKKK